jgi:predicted dehydrogenase
MHLPNIKAMPEQLQLRAVASRTGQNAVATAAQYGAAYSTTDPAEVLADPDVDLVIIATRHDQHADLVIRSLEAGKHVLVEKPLALRREELDRIRAWFDRPDSSPILMTGFNRRFSPYLSKVAEAVRSRSNPLLMTYRMNAGHLPSDHWTHGPEGGGRNVGEACHIYDLFTFLTGSRVAEIQATSIRPSSGYYRADDNFVATVRFVDGSVGSLAYTALGSSKHAKEQVEVFVDGKVLVLDDYRRLTQSGVKTPLLTSSVPEKGQREELAALADAMTRTGQWPIPLWQQLQAMEIAFAVDDAIRPGSV